MCRTKKYGEANIATVTAYADEAVAFLGSLSADAEGNPWMTNINFNSHRALFKIDSGAYVTAVPETLYARGQFGNLVKATRILQGPGGTPLKVKAEFTATLSKNEHSISDTDSGV